MDLLQLTQIPASSTGMLIRKPVAEVFEAMLNPAVTTQFWFTKSSGRLEPGTQVQWEWEMYAVSITVSVDAIEPNRRIVLQWPGYRSPTTVEWLFTAHSEQTTFVAISETGFTGSGDEILRQVTDSTQGFTLVLAGLKAFLEHGIPLNLVADRYPQPA